MDPLLIVFGVALVTLSPNLIAGCANMTHGGAATRLT